MIVLDTHVLIWMDADDAALGPQARARIEQAWRAGEVAVSAISFWECAMLVEKGRIALPLVVLLLAGLFKVPLFLKPELRRHYGEETSFGRGGDHPADFQCSQFL